MRFNTKFWDQNERDNKVKEWHEHIIWANQERDYYRFITNLLINKLF